MTGLELVLVAGATFRLSRLVVEDEWPFAPLRHTIDAHVDGRITGALAWWLAALVSCVWCVSMWIAAGVAAWAYYADGAAWFAWPAAALTASAAAGALDRWTT